VVGEAIPMRAPPGIEVPRREVVGVIADIAFAHPRDDPVPMMFFPVSGASAFESILIQSTASIADIRATFQSAIDSGDLPVTIESIRNVEEAWGEGLAPDRARTWFTVAAAALVVLLAGFGFYGTQRFLVAAGQREYAILGALGAGPRALRLLVLRRGLLQGLPGLALASVLAFIVVAWMRGDFVSGGVSPAGIAAIVTVGVIGLLLAATFGPARQAGRTEPAPLLKEE
jgi:ABC-type antimicrobial peptide transport system permease subunit